MDVRAIIKFAGTLNGKGVTTPNPLKQKRKQSPSNYNSIAMEGYEPLPPSSMDTQPQRNAGYGVVGGKSYNDAIYDNRRNNIPVSRGSSIRDLRQAHARPAGYNSAPYEMTSPSGYTSLPPSEEERRSAQLNSIHLAPKNPIPIDQIHTLTAPTEAELISPDVSQLPAWYKTPEGQYKLRKDRPMPITQKNGWNITTEDPVAWEGYDPSEIPRVYRVTDSMNGMEDDYGIQDAFERGMIDRRATSIFQGGVNTSMNMQSRIIDKVFKGDPKLAHDTIKKIVEYYGYGRQPSMSNVMGNLPPGVTKQQFDAVMAMDRGNGYMSHLVGMSGDPGYATRLSKEKQDYYNNEGRAESNATFDTHAALNVGEYKVRSALLKGDFEKAYSALRNNPGDVSAFRFNRMLDDACDYALSVYGPNHPITQKLKATRGSEDYRRKMEAYVEKVNKNYNDPFGY